ncbi:YopJ/AvrA family T3SS effector serine/threonine acetyltransferase [Bartonella gliris]|uniref:YopJ/AvrA family T3SS effector serine/threonine acetyltransferase n=1 Tax=Bartonella gliris TaxID=3004109 RepID=UPI00295F2D0A|nr:YopJ/AvrA family T3SS effector serine/threonine acetyltransferase [Bartonella gliris]
MKPRDSKTPPQSSSQTQESSAQTQASGGASQALESFLARLEATVSKTPELEDIAHNPEKLQELITNLESDIASGEWLRANYAEMDLKMMPALVKQANTKYPEMQLKYATNPEELASSIKETINEGVQSSRFITNTGQSGIHFAVIDHQTINNETSLILIEPASFDKLNAGIMGARVKIALEKLNLPNCHFSMVEMNIQQSNSECGIFSLALAKKLHTEADKLMRLHRDNVNGVLCEPNTPLPSDQLDQYLPPSFYKHTQGRKRFKKYIERNPEAENTKVNKKGETLRERFEKSLVKTEGKTVSVSSHRKRTSEYKSLML